MLVPLLLAYWHKHANIILPVSAHLRIASAPSRLVSLSSFPPRFQPARTFSPRIKIHFNAVVVKNPFGAVYTLFHVLVL
jgi:hypothetical protein